MAGIGIIFDDAKLLRDLKSITRAVENLSLPMKLTGEYLAMQIRDRIRAGGPAPDGTPWEQLSEKYKALKQGANRDTILMLKGKLMTNVRYQTERRAVAVGVNLPYGAAHQLGFDGEVSVRAFRRKNKRNDVYAKVGGKRRKIASGVGFVRAHTRHMYMPSRPFLGLSDQDYNEIPRIFTRWMEKR